MVAFKQTSKLSVRSTQWVSAHEQCTSMQHYDLGFTVVIKTYCLRFNRNNIRILFWTWSLSSTRNKSECEQKRTMGKESQYFPIFMQTSSTDNPICLNPHSLHCPAVLLSVLYIVCIAHTAFTALHVLWTHVKHTVNSHTLTHNLQTN